MADPTSTTQGFEEVAWLPPVASAKLLPAEGTAEGTLCFVDDERAIYQFRQGKWTRGGKGTAKGP